MSVVVPSRRYAWKSKIADVDLNPPTFNTAHEVVEITGGAKLYLVAVIQTNTPTNDADVDVIITLDGAAYTYDSSAAGALPNNQTNYYFGNQTAVTVTDFYVDQNANAYPTVLLNTTAPFRGLPLVGSIIKVEVKQTSALDAAARIRAKVYYEQLEAV